LPQAKLLKFGTKVPLLGQVMDLGQQVDFQALMKFIPLHILKRLHKNILLYKYLVINI